MQSESMSKKVRVFVRGQYKKFLDWHGANFPGTPPPTLEAFIEKHPEPRFAKHREYWKKAKEMMQEDNNAFY